MPWVPYRRFVLCYEWTLWALHERDYRFRATCDLCTFTPTSRTSGTQLSPSGSGRMVLVALSSEIWCMTNHQRKCKRKARGLTIQVQVLSVIVWRCCVHRSPDEEVPGGRPAKRIWVEPKVKTLTEEDLTKYTIFDVIMPLPGIDVAFPGGKLGDRCREFLTTDGLDPNNFHRKQRYRSIESLGQFVA